VRIVGNWRPICALGWGLALAGTVPALAQTVTVGGDWRPQIEVDKGVLDRLGPQPTLPDMLLGRQPMPIAGGPVKLHRPHHPAGQALLLKPPAEHPVAAAKVRTKERPVKLAEAAPPKDNASSADLADAGKEKPAKKLVSNFEPPPAPRHTPPPANADMPTVSSAEPPPAAGQPERKMATPPPAIAVSSEPLPATAPKVASAAPAPAPTPAPQPLTPTVAPPPAPAPAPAPAPVASNAPAPAEKPAATKQAMLTPPAPAANADGGANLSIPFAVDGAELGDDAKRALLAVAKRTDADASTQLLILAYSSGDDASKARRLSLSRALAVRSFLKDQGVPSARIEVRALGNKVPEGSPDRVDLVEQKH